MNNKYISRSSTPWDSYNEKSPLESFLALHYHNHFDNHHKLLSEEDEADLINSVKIDECKFCDSTELIKSGFTRNNIQRYYCRNCKGSFTPLKQTIFENHKLSISEWIEFLLNLFGYESITQISKNNKKSFTTTKYWIEKVFLLLKDSQEDILLHGDVYIDEAFYKVRKDEIKLK